MTNAEEKPVPNRFGIGTAQACTKGPFGRPWGAPLLLHTPFFGPSRQSEIISFIVCLVAFWLFGMFSGRNLRFLSSSRRLVLYSKKCFS